MKEIDKISYRAEFTSHSRGKDFEAEQFAELERFLKKYNWSALTYHSCRRYWDTKSPNRSTALTVFIGVNSNYYLLLEGSDSSYLQYDNYNEFLEQFELLLMVYP